MLPADPAARRARALLSLDGLSVGDALGTALGEGASSPEQLRWLVSRTDPPFAPWPTTDDTEMGIAVVETLEASGTIDEAALAGRFAARFAREPWRGYGGTARRILAALAAGGDFRAVALAAFDGQGSMGNGAAMRAMPVGAWFADDPDRAAEEARRSARPTHTHPDGEAGAVAAALAAAWAARRSAGLERGPLLDFVLARLPPGEVRDGVAKAAALPPGASTVLAVQTLGSGQRVIAADTVPFALWCAAREADDFAAALWRCADGFGDRDTTCAIVGGIVALSAGRASIPARWLAAREPLRPT